MYAFAHNIWLLCVHTLGRTLFISPVYPLRIVLYQPLRLLRPSIPIVALPLPLFHHAAFLLRLDSVNLHKAPTTGRNPRRRDFVGRYRSRYLGNEVNGRSPRRDILPVWMLLFLSSTRTRETKAILLNGEIPGGKARLWRRLIGKVYAKTNSSTRLNWKLSKVQVTRSSSSKRDNCFCADNQRELDDCCWENINCYRCTAHYYYLPDRMEFILHEWKDAFEIRAILLSS